MKRESRKAKAATSKAVALPDNVNPVDPHQINTRLQRQLDTLLTQLETSKTVTLRERVQALIAIARIQVAFVGLRKEKAKDDTAGSAVKRYAQAFANDPRRRTTIAGSTEDQPERQRRDDDGGEWWDDAESDDEPA